jgi:hypothetical protein
MCLSDWALTMGDIARGGPCVDDRIVEFRAGCSVPSHLSGSAGD